MLFHFLGMKPPMELIMLVVPFLSEPQAPLTPDHSALALFTVPDLMLFHLLLMKPLTELNMPVVPFLRLFYVFLTPEHIALALNITEFIMLDLLFFYDFYLTVYIFDFMFF